MMRRLLQQQPPESEATTLVVSDWTAFVYIYSSGQYFKSELVHRNDDKLIADLIRISNKKILCVGIFDFVRIIIETRKSIIYLGVQVMVIDAQLGRMYFLSY